MGDRLGTVNFIGQVTGLQTPTTQAFVTVEPQVIVQGTETLDLISRAELRHDARLVRERRRFGVPVIVSGVGDTGVQGVVVHYTLVRTLASSSPSRQAVYITNATALSNVDTTNSAGATTINQINVKANLLSRRGSRDRTEGGQRDRPGDGDVLL